MKKYRDYTLKEYLNSLSMRAPVPGGGSAAALSGALGAALISMVANYSIGRKHSANVEVKIKKILADSERIRKRLLVLVDLDAQAYLKVVATRKAKVAARKAALKRARAVPLEACQLCYSAVQLTPFLVKEGNPYLLSDVQVAIDLLWAAYQSAMANVRANQ